MSLIMVNGRMLEFTLVDALTRLTSLEKKLLFRLSYFHFKAYHFTSRSQFNLFRDYLAITNHLHLKLSC